MSKRKKRESAYAVCPFYKKELPDRIYCEGITENSSLILAFGDEEGKRRYRRYYCEYCWKCCRIAAMLEKKYEEESRHE